MSADDSPPLSISPAAQASLHSVVSFLEAASMSQKPIAHTHTRLTPERPEKKSTLPAQSSGGGRVGHSDNRTFAGRERGDTPTVKI